MFLELFLTVKFRLSVEDFYRKVLLLLQDHFTVTDYEILSAGQSIWLYLSEPAYAMDTHIKNLARKQEVKET